MAIRRGFAKVKEAKESASKGGGGGGLRFMLQDGQSAVVRFFGDFEGQNDPIVGVQHYVRRLPNGKQYHMCADNLPEGTNQGCVFCHMQNSGDKGIKKQQRAFLWLKDLRKVHKLEQVVKILKPGIPRIPGKVYQAADYIETKYPPCTAPRSPCSYCKGGNQAQLEGFRYWELAVQYADQLVSQQAAIREFCKCGGRTEDSGGTIQINRYVCGAMDEEGNLTCGEEVDFDPNKGQPVVYCKSCRNNLPPLEEISCTNCETPARCDLQDFLFKVTRTGGGTDTTYNFEAVKQASPTEEDLKEAEEKKPDFEAMLQPEAPELQAAHLGVPSPFQTPGHGAQGYGQQRPSPQAPGGPRKLGIGNGVKKLGASQPPQQEVDYGEYQ